MSSKFENLDLEGPVLVTPDIFNDERGYFVKLLTKEEFEANLIDTAFVEEFESESKKGVIRGLHYQLYPHVEGKLIRVLSGRIFDVVVDIRKKSPNFGKWTGVNLSSEKFESFWVPPGFAHGFLSLEDETRVLYKVTAKYSPEDYRGILWKDEDIAINWPIKADPLISRKDSNLPRLKEAQINFAYSNKDLIPEYS